MQWYYVDQGKQAGPVSDGELEQLLLSGTVAPETLVWNEGMAAWAPCREAKPAPVQPGKSVAAPPVVAFVPQAGEAVCAECGKVFPIDETIPYANVRICAGCKPAFMQKVAEGMTLQSVGVPNYGGFWIRVAAKIVDNIIIGIPLVIVVIAVMFAQMGPIIRSGRPGAVPQFNPIVFPLIQFGMIFSRLVLDSAYQMFFLGKFGATPGKMVCGLRVVTAEGGAIGYGKALCRSLADIINRMTCGLTYIMVAFDSEKRGLHDHICGTRVVYK